MEFFIDILTDAWKDTWLMIPILYVVYLFIDSLDRKTDQSDSFFWKLQKYGPLFGALLGLIPQCGFSILAAMLYVSNNITLGTTIAVFLATSDEAVPILISQPDMIPSLGVLLVLKFIAAAVIGTLIDKVLYRHQHIVRFEDLEEEEEVEETDEKEAENLEEDSQSACSCCYTQYPVWLSALLRTIKIYLFVFVVTLAMNAITGWIGEDKLAAFLQTQTLWQPAAAALFGFIPNCAATVVLCSLYSSHALTFGSLFAGLMTNAGLGLVALFQYSTNKKAIWKTALLMYVPAVLLGYLLQLVPALF